MESSKQSLPVAISLTLLYFQLNSNKINLTKQMFPSISLVVLFCAITLATAVSSAAPPEHANHDLVSMLSPGSGSSKNSNKEEWARGRILVMPRAGLPAKAFAEILKEHEGKARKIGQSDLYIVYLPEYSEEGTLTKLQHHPHIKFAELDRIVHPTLIPNDPKYGEAWHLQNIGASAAWDIAQGSGITIAILDSGIDGTHPDLIENIVAGWNFYDNNSNTSDVFGHGTKVAGAAAAATNNSIGVAAVAGQSKIMPIRVTDTNGYGYDGSITQALIYAADNGARVANISFQNVSNSSSIRAAAQYMKDKDGLVTVSGGNTGSLENFTVTTTMIPISATDNVEIDTITSWSSYGDYIALAAPGDNIWSTLKGGSNWVVSGTSFASPVVGGVIALMMSANSKLSGTEIENLLFSTAVDLGAGGRDPYYGYGRVNAAAAVQAAKSALPTQDTEAPTISIIDPLGGTILSGLVPVDVEAADNVSVTRAELWVNNTSVAVDSSPPLAFSWDSTGVPNGAVNLIVRAFDAAGNSASSNIEVAIENPVPPPAIDTEPPAVQIVNPVAGNVTGNVTITLNASDNSGSAGITLSIYIDGALKATGTGSTLSTSWNTRSKSVKAGSHTIQAMAKDAAGNTSSTSVIVKK